MDKLLLLMLISTLIACVVIPEMVVAEFPIQEYSEYWLHAPTWRHGALLGTYKQENLLYVVARAGRTTFYICGIALAISIAGGILLIYLDFSPTTRPFFHKLLPVAVYFPRLFFLILLASLLRLQQTSQLTLSVSHYLAILFGITGAIFLASQTAEEIAALRDKLFVHFAHSLGWSDWQIFLRHILPNCSSLPISIVKQMRDNIVFLSILSFIGVVHLQPSDLGGLIYEYARTPESFTQGWWILAAPCIFLSWLLLIFDLAGERLATGMAKRPLIDKL